LEAAPVAAAASVTMVVSFFQSFKFVLEFEMRDNMLLSIFVLVSLYVVIWYMTYAGTKTRLYRMWDHYIP